MYAIAVFFSRSNQLFDSVLYYIYLFPNHPSRHVETAHIYIYTYIHIYKYIVCHHKNMAYFNPLNPPLALIIRYSRTLKMF